MSHTISIKDVAYIDHEITLASCSKPGKRLIICFKFKDATLESSFMVKNNTGLVVHCSDYLSLAVKVYNNLP